MSKDSDNSSGNKKKASGSSHSENHSIIYTWEINEITSFIHCARDTEGVHTVDSPEFSTGAEMRDSWKLQLVIKKDYEFSKIKTWISINVLPINKNRKVRTKYSFFLLNNKREKTGTNLTCNNQWSFPTWWYNHQFEDFIGREHHLVKIDDLLRKKDEYLQNETLTVGIELIVYDDYVAINSTLKALESSKRKMSDDFKDLLVAKRKCDVTIKVGDEKFETHKAILVARSCIFDAMFSHNMKENKENEVTIRDVDPQVFKKLLDFIYTDEVEDLDSFSEELLEVSDKYHLQGLKEMCEDSLSESLTLKNAINVMILADRHNAKRLKESAINYVSTNLIKFKNTEEFKALEQTQQFLYFAVLKNRFAIETD